MEKRMATRPVEFRADEVDGQKHIAGYFVVFDDVYEMPDGTVEQIDRHAADGAIGKDIRCLTTHDSRLVLGRTAANTMSMRIDDHGIFADVIINDTDTDAVNTWARVKRRDVTHASFGFDIIREMQDRLPDGRIRWLVTELELYELTVCTFPAYESTDLQARDKSRVSRRSSAAETWRENAKRRLKSNGT